MNTNNSSKKIKVLFNDDFTLYGDFNSMMEYNVSFYVKELSAMQLKRLYRCGVNVSTSQVFGWFIIVEKRLIKEVDFYEC